MSLSSSASPSASHFLPFLGPAALAPRDLLVDDSSPEEAGAELKFAALRALREPFPPGPAFPVSICPAGVLGRELSGVATGVESFEVRSL